MPKGLIDFLVSSQPIAMVGISFNSLTLFCLLIWLFIVSSNRNRLFVSILSLKLFPCSIPMAFSTETKGSKFVQNFFNRPLKDAYK